MDNASVLEQAADLARRRWEFRTADKLTRAHLDHVENGCPLAGVVAQCGIEQYASNYLAEWSLLSDAPNETFGEGVTAAVQQALVDNIGEQLAAVLETYGNVVRGLARRASALRRERQQLLWLHALAVWRLGQLNDEAPTETTRHHLQMHADAAHRLEELGAHGVARDIGEANNGVAALHTEIDRLRAELDALKADAVTLPDDWRQRLATPAPQSKAEWDLLNRVAGHLFSWRPKPGIPESISTSSGSLANRQEPGSVTT